jgi:adenylosuccinate synthase
MQESLDSFGKNIAIIGAQWGDEGKGKLVDAISDQFEIICRSAGGANAGHTIVVKDKKYIFKLLPSCLLRPETIGVLGNGTVVDPMALITELESLEASGLSVRDRVKVSLKAQLIFGYHKQIDEELENRKGKNKIGTTKRGIGPAYTDKVARIGIRCEDLLDKDQLAMKIRRNAASHSELYNIEIDAEAEIERIMAVREEVKPFLIDTRKYLQDAISAGRKILFEGAQGHHLDVDHGTYPFVTSSSTSLGGVCTGLGVAPKHIHGVIAIVKAYTTRVGSGPFPVELTDEVGKHLQDVGHEFGSVTGRPRRCGWLDAVVVKEAVEANGVDVINLTKIDVMSGLKELKIATNYYLDGKELFSVPTTVKALAKLEIKYATLPGWDEDITQVQTFDGLPKNAQDYVLAVEKYCGAKVSSIGVGPARSALIYR